MEIQCANKCGNLTMEDSDFCEICTEVEKQKDKKSSHDKYLKDIKSAWDKYLKSEKERK